MALTPFLDKKSFTSQSPESEYDDGIMLGEKPITNVNFGASGTNTDALTQGALLDLLNKPKMSSIITQAQDIADKTLGDYTPSEPDWGVMSLLYFSKMAEEASKPGATALGAAGSAFTTPAAYLMQKQKDEADRKEARETKKASLMTTLIPSLIKAKDTKTSATTNYEIRDAELFNKTFGTNYSVGEIVPLNQQQFTKAPQGSLSSYIKPSDKKTKNVAFYKLLDDGNWQEDIVPENSDKFAAYNVSKDWTTVKPPSSVQPLKTTKGGELALYKTKEDAIAFLNEYNLDPKSNNYKDLLKKLTAPTPDLVGEPIIQGGAYVTISPLTKGGEILRLQLSPSLSGHKPEFTIFKNERMKGLAKARGSYIENITGTIPKINQALTILRSKDGPKTGALTNAMLPFKKFFQDTFAIQDPTIKDLESLQSISYFLATKMRPEGSGSTSDMEFKAYMKTALYLGNSPEANYISLYTLKKMKENSSFLAEKESELLTKGTVRNFTQLNKELKKVDAGLFEKYTGKRGEEGAQEFAEWYNNLPSGAVIMNNTVNGQKLFDSNDPYIIKDWRTQ